MNKNLLFIGDKSKQPLKRLSKSLSEKNNIFHNIDNDIFYDYIFVESELYKFDDLLDVKYKYLLYFKDLKGKIIDNFDEVKIAEILNNELPKEVEVKNNFLGFFCFNFYDSREKNDILYRFLNDGKVGIELEFDSCVTYFCTKHLVKLIVDIIREPDRIFTNKLLEVNRFVNLSYIDNYSYSELASFCNHNLVIKNKNICDSPFCGNGEKLKKLFLTGKNFNLAEGILSNQR